MRIRKITKINVLALTIVCMLIASCGGGGSSSGSSSVNAPGSLAGLVYRLTISSGSGLFAQAGTSTVSFASTQNVYAVVGDGVNVADSAGTFTYTTSGNIGLISFVDTFIGNGSFALTFTSSTSGTFLASASVDPASSQSGSFIQL